jgi:hypothetical protein
MKRLVSIAFLVGLVLCVASVASAKGTVRVQKSDGSNQVYSNVTLRIVDQTLRITTEDGKGTLVIKRAACSYQGEIMVCLPYELALEQGGQEQPLDFSRGTLYYNGTDTKQQMSLSSTEVPPNGVIGLLITKKGTIIAISGVIDEHAK